MNKIHHNQTSLTEKYKKTSIIKNLKDSISFKMYKEKNIMTMMIDYTICKFNKYSLFKN